MFRGVMLPDAFDPEFRRESRIGRDDLESVIPVGIPVYKRFRDHSRNNAVPYVLTEQVLIHATLKHGVSLAPVGKCACMHP